MAKYDILRAPLVTTVTCPYCGSSMVVKSTTWDGRSVLYCDLKGCEIYHREYWTYLPRVNLQNQTGT